MAPEALRDPPGRGGPRFVGLLRCAGDADFVHLSLHHLRRRLLLLLYVHVLDVVFGGGVVGRGIPVERWVRGQLVAELHVAALPSVLGVGADGLVRSRSVLAPGGDPPAGANPSALSGTQDAAVMRTE